MKSLFLITSCFFAVISFARTNDTTKTTWHQLRNTWPKEKLDDHDILPITDGNQIRYIEVLDMRSDTNSIGLYTGRGQKPHSVVTEAGLSTLFNKKLVNNPAGHQLLFVIKSLWVNEVNSIVAYNKQVYPTMSGGATTIPSGTTNVSTTKMKCAIDVFIQLNNQYYPLTRIDSLLVNRKKVSKAAEATMNDALELINQKVNKGLASGNYMKKSPASLPVIAENYSTVFSVPVLQDGSLKKGVYYTWEQLKNNQPEPVDFVIQKNDKEPPTLYLKDEHGSEILTRKVFAVNDGIKTYKIQDGYVFQLFRDKRCIYWMGVERRDIAERSIPILLPAAGVAGFGTEAIGSKMRILLTPYLLNLETGLEY